MIGSTINQYKILDQLGEGGMGVVFLAEDTRLQRKAALKFISSSTHIRSEERKRFDREAQAAARLTHPNICTVYELGENEEQAFIALEYVEGETLKERIRQGNISNEEIRDWLRQIADGLHTAHEAGVIHRDIKPANIMLTHRGHIKIMDFGIAKLSVVETELTQANSTIGTIAYMSPEQARGEKVDRRSDIWSIGVILYELATGQRPFSGAFREAMMYAMMHEDVRPPSDLNPNIPEDLERIINTCLERERTDRFGSLKDILDMLEGKDPGLIKAKEEGQELTAVRVLKPGTDKDPTLLGAKRRRLIALGIVVFLGLLAAIPGLRQQLIRSGESSTGLPSAMHLAVLPFDTISDTPEDRAFANGLAHLVATNLMQMEHDKEELWIIPVREVLSQNITSTKEAKESFGINLGISGTLVTFGNTIQINLDLTDASTLRVVESATIELEELKPQEVQGQVLSKLREILDLGEPVDSDPMLVGLTSDPEAYKLYVQGQGFLQKYEDLENINEAIRLFEQAISHDSMYALAYAGAGFALARKYQFTREIEAIQLAAERTNRALSLNNELPEVWVAIARQHWVAEEYHEAIEAGQRAVELAPDIYDTNRVLAISYAYNNESEKSIPFFDKAISIQPNYWDGYNAYALMYSSFSNEKEKAVPLYEKVIELSPNNAWGYQNLGSLYRQLGELEKAETLYLQAVEIRPLAITYNNLGWTAWETGENEKAVEYFLKANEVAPDNEIWTLFLAYGYLMVGDSLTAHATWERAAAIADERLDKVGKEYNSLLVGAEANAMIGRLDKAQIYLDHLLSLEINNTGFYNFEIALVFETLNDRAQALDYLEKAYQLGFDIGVVESYPWLIDLVADPAYKALVDKYNEFESENQR